MATQIGIWGRRRRFALAVVVVVVATIVLSELVRNLRGFADDGGLVVRRG
jgi:hypothetical protein